jgi:transcriptional regulator with GAF, ATPase, and Fis domain
MLSRRHNESSLQGHSSIRWSPEAESLLQAQPWPGNLRELDNVVRRAYALASSEQCGKDKELVLCETHVREALGSRMTSGESELFNKLEEVAKTFVSVIRQRRQAGQTLSLDLIDAVRAFVVSEAFAECGTIERSLELIGRGGLLVNRNHHKFIRTEIQRVETLCSVLREDIPASIRALVTRERAG